MSSNFQPFDSAVESISEFLERFSVQKSDELEIVSENQLKKARLLIKSLPLACVTELQRKLKPVKLSEAT